MLNSQDVLEKMRQARSWKEFGMSVGETYQILISGMNTGVEKSDDKIAALQEENARLAETNRKLRQEVKQKGVRG